MKHKPQTPAKWTKILPWRKRLEEKAKPKVAVLNLHGMIANSSLNRRNLSIHSTQKLIDKAFDTKKCEAVFLSINSPGGSAVQSELIADYIGQKSTEKKVPVISFVEDVAASGGYWLATAAPTIYCSKSSIIGSIGVISQKFGFHEAIKKLGIERRTQTAGDFKAFGDPFKAEQEKDVAIVRNILSALHENFKAQVKSSRKDKLKEAEASDSELFSGKVWVGQEAVSLGLVDGIYTMNRFIEAEMGGTQNVSIVKVATPNSPLTRLLGQSEYSSEFQFGNTAFAEQVAKAFIMKGQDQDFSQFKV